MDLEAIMYNFKNFIELSWPAIDSIEYKGLEKQDFIADWIQANWEILVELPLFKGTSKFLEVYGEGADCDPLSSRVWKPQAKPTNAIYIKSKNSTALIDEINGEDIREEMLFGKFIAWSDNKYYEAPPFNAILIENESGEHVVSLNKVQFFLGPAIG